VLDAWVNDYAPSAYKSFRERGTYRERTIYVSLPVMLEGRREAIAELKVKDLHPICEQERWCIRILGEGGVGKTTLTCQLAIWAMNADERSRLCRDRRMLPVLIEPGIGFDVRKDLGAFRQAVGGQLQDSIGMSY
jgi:hypothetical protein